jgi:acyl-homoserine lactone acylase PvdQ
MVTTNGLRPAELQAIPGGESGNPARPWFGNQLDLWLTNEYHEATTRRGDVDVAQRLRFVSAS